MSVAVPKSPWLSPGAWLRRLPAPDSLAAYGWSGLILAIAYLAKAQLDAIAGEPLPAFLAAPPVVALAALIGGPRVGLVAVGGATLLAWFLWLPPPGALLVPTRGSAIYLVGYIACALVIALVVGTARLFIESSAAQQAGQVMAARESVHRIKNMLALVRAIAFKVEREVGGLPEFMDVFQRRLSAMEVAQDILLRSEWADTDLRELLKTVLAPFLPNPGLTVAWGPDAVVPARHVRGLCLALHELATNSMKYGALAGGAGPVVLSWRHDGSHCVLSWNEGARSTQERPGFGTWLVEAALSKEAKTSVDYRLSASGIVATFKWPIDLNHRRLDLT